MKKIKDSFFVRGVKFLFAGFLAVLLFAGCNNGSNNDTKPIAVKFPITIPCKADSDNSIVAGDVKIVIKTYNTTTHEGVYELTGTKVSSFPPAVGTEGTFKITISPTTPPPPPDSPWKMSVTPTAPPTALPQGPFINSSRELEWFKGGKGYKYDIPASMLP